MIIDADTEEEAEEIAEWQLHHNPKFLEEHAYETEADITEIEEGTSTDELHRL